MDLWKNNQLTLFITTYEMKIKLNVDKAGKFYNLLPNEILPSKDDNCRRGKNS